MLTRQSVAASCARELAELATLLESGHSCLVECDKDLNLFLFADLRTRLHNINLSFFYADGRPKQDEPDWDGRSVIGTMVMQIHKAVRQRLDRCVVILPRLDVLTADSAGLTDEAREIIPLLYEVSDMIWLGFRDPTLTLLPIVEKRFRARVQVKRPGGTTDHSPA
jgi:cell division protease FtsH